MTTYPQGEFNLAIAYSVAGKPFTVRLIAVGERFGREGVLINEGEPRVAFYDRTYLDHDRYTGALGQFVADYYLETLLDRDPGRGLLLQGDIPEWNVSGQSLTNALATLQRNAERCA